MKVVILGTAHGSNVAGKRSPDGLFREYQYSREIVSLIKPKLEAKGYVVFIDIPEDIVPMPQSAELQKRASFVNNICAKYGTDNCIYVSIHINAAGAEGKWLGAGGWCAYTPVGTTKSDTLAECLYEAAEEELRDYTNRMVQGKLSGHYTTQQRPIRTDKADGDNDIESNFYVLKHTKCAAVLTENLFQDNKSDVSYLLSERGKEAIVNLHIKGITKYLSL